MHCELIVDARNGTGESPVWHPSEQALYWVDIPARQLHRWQDGAHQVWQGDEMLACIARTERGWVAGMESGIFQLQAQADGRLDSSRVAAVEHPQHGMRFNDGRCDRQGRFWAGSMLMDMQQGAHVGALYRLDGEGRLHQQLKDMIVPNGLAFSPDGSRMYLSDSHPNVQKIWTFDYDTDSGTPHNQRLFVDMRAFLAAPTAPPLTPTAATGSAATTPGRSTASPRRAPRPLAQPAGKETGDVRLWRGQPRHLVRHLDPPCRQRPQRPAPGRWRVCPAPRRPRPGGTCLARLNAAFATPQYPTLTRETR